MSDQQPGELPLLEDRERLVHVAFRWNCQRDAREVIGAGFNWTPAIGVLLVVGTHSGLGWLDRAVTGGIAACFFIPAAALAFAIPYLIRLLRLPRAPEWVTEAIDHSSDSRFRLRLIASSRIAERLRPLGEPPSEPLIFRVTQNFTRVGGWEPAPVLVLFCIIALCWLGVNGLPAANRYYVMPLFAFGWVGVVGAWSFCWPTYLRIAPGRLDVICYGFLGRGDPETQTYDLSTAGLVVDARQKRVLIETTDGGRDLIRYGSIRDDLGFAKAMLEAARSVGPSPPLPTDALIG